MKTALHLIAGLALGLVGVASSWGQETDAQLDAFFKQYLEETFRQQPMEATRLGDHRFDHLLDDVSRAARAGWVERQRRALADLPRRVAMQELSPAARIDAEILLHHLAASIWLAENLQPFERDPRTYSDYISDSTFLLLAQSTLPKETNIAHCIARMAEIPKVVAAARENLSNPPRVATETAILQNRGAIAFYERGILDLAGETPQRAELAEAARTVAGCLKGYQEFLEKDLLPRANGQWRIGREKFARKLDLELDSGATAEQVLADAESEFARVESEMVVIARQLWSRYYPRQPLPPDDAEGRRLTVEKVLTSVGKEHGRPEDLAGDARASVARIKQFIEQNGILRLPQPDHCQVIEMPEFKRGNSTAYLESAPPLDPNAPSMYAVSPPPADWDQQRVNSLLEEYNRHMLQILTIHEAYPGHYVQLEYSNRNPSLIRRVLGSGVSIEGWAVYTEQMMLDQGYGREDLALRLTQLKFYLRAVTNAILDHKMHCAEMTDEEAMALLVGKAFQSEGEARLKVIRAKQTSCQLSTYFVGRMAMCRLRTEIQRQMGDRFELDRYHQAVLDEGSVPVKYLPRLVRGRLGIAQ